MLPRWLIRQSAILLALLSLATPGKASVDPVNASYFIVDRHDDPMSRFNITNKYHRDIILTKRLYTFNGQHCQPARRYVYIPYWINPNELPSVIRRYNASNYNEDIDDARQIYRIIAHIVNRVFKEMRISTYKLPSQAAYNTLLRYMLPPSKSTAGTVFSYFIPIQIHFRPLPYPQSSFLEFVSNRQRRWEVYDDSIYAAHAGNDDDLLYRLRHNLRHSLGLGHTTNDQCVMFPTNVRKLSDICQHEIKALHHLLCNPQLEIFSHNDANLTHVLSIRHAQ